MSVLAFEPGFKPREEAWSSLSKIGSSESELFHYLVKTWLEARAFEPEPRLVPPLFPFPWIISSLVVRATFQILAQLTQILILKLAFLCFPAEAAKNLLCGKISTCPLSVAQLLERQFLSDKKTFATL